MVSWSNYKKTSNFNSALAPEERKGQLRGTNLSNGPSSTFSSQWNTKQGYNVRPSSLGGIQISNPNPVVAEPNEPWKPMPSTGFYRPSNRKNVLNSLPKGEFLARPENIPANYTAGVYARPLVMPVYVPRRTNGAPIPKRSRRNPRGTRRRPRQTKK